MSATTLRRGLLGVACVALVAPLAACGTDEAAGAEGAIAVQAADDSCNLAITSAPAGTTTYSVKNTGNQVTEFYVYAGDGQQIVGEVENIGPGLTRDLTVSLEPGSYVTSCRPGMAGDGIRAQFDVTDGTADSATDDPALVAASAAYADWVTGEVALLQSGTQQFAAAVTAGDVESAKALYPEVRAHWEAIEPVAESFGDLDPKMDAREGDLDEGVAWTGWHRLEKDLWVSGLQADSATIAAQLVADTDDLVARVATLKLTADRVTNGAKELLDEVATTKITGEEERYSHTDLWDFQANVEGAKKSYDVVAEVARQKDPQLAATLDAEFAAMQADLDAYRSGDGFVLYTELTDEQIRALSAQVEALSEPLSQLTTTILS